MGTSGSGSTDDVSDAITADTLGLASGTKIVTATSKDTSVAEVTDVVRENADVAADAVNLGQVAASTNASAGTYIKSFKITAVGAGSTYIDVKIIDTATSTESHKYIPVKVSSDKKLASKTAAAIKSEVTDKNPDENKGGAADVVIAKINAIGTVAYTDESKAKIDDARAAYDALTEAQKKLVPAETLALLTAAESAYAELKASASTVPVTAITLNKTETEITAGEKETLSVAEVLPDNAKDKSVTWSSGNMSVATVNAETGEVTAKAAGTAYITATANDGSGVQSSCKVTVRNPTLADVFTDGAVVCVAVKNEYDTYTVTGTYSGGSYTNLSQSAKYHLFNFSMTKDGNNLVVWMERTPSSKCTITFN
ncbi:MAG: Ig domain-containing protein, partial [Bacteroidaceae bacterium]|nr:Ig domain-containing protein [Bacteroidaceae bacterium]